LLSAGRDSHLAANLTGELPTDALIEFQRSDEQKANVEAEAWRASIRRRG